MAWTITRELDDFLSAANGFLEKNPAANTIALTLVARLSSLGMQAFGEQPPLFGSWRDPDDELTGAFVHTPPHPLVLGNCPPAAAAALVGALRKDGHQLTGASVPIERADAIAAAWSEHAGAAPKIRERLRLYRLGTLTPADPGPGGAARHAGLDELPLLTAWFKAFAVEAEHDDGPDPSAAIVERIEHGGLWVWTDPAGEPASMAGVSRELAGMARIGPVYTPPELRGHGYGSAVTAAASQFALDRGAREVLLFTDLSNPISNSIYQRLGYRPVGDRVVVALEG